MRDDRGRVIIPGAFAATCLTLAVAQIALGIRAELWDDALFFRRIAYNIIHHGVAGWNHQDGPVFMSTSQIHQLVSTALLLVAPQHFNVAIVLWSAACLWMSFAVLQRLLRQIGQSNELGDYALFALMQAPPLILAVGTGMDTCTVILAVAFALYSLLSPRFGGNARIAVLANILVYLSRPDAVLLSFGVALGVFAGLPERRWQRMFQFLVFTAAGIAVLTVIFHFYYGTGLPLATRLKVSPVSLYDRDYLALGALNKRLNIYMTALVAAPLIFIAALRLDRLNVALTTSALAFVGFHAATTNEIMGYHARFYAPALPLLIVAAARAVGPHMSTGRRIVIVAATTSAAFATFLAFRSGRIESSSHHDMLEHISASWYLPFYSGLILLAVGLCTSERVARPATRIAATVTVAVMAFLLIPAKLRVATDAEIDGYALGLDGSLRGLDVIRRCFREPLQLMHSELGIPGALFPESRIIDYTGLGNPSVISGTFDFEAICEHDRPDFIFRPHVSHQRLNRIIDGSHCLASRYVAVTSIRESSSPLYVRSDLLERYNACRPSSSEAR
jgi:hypothetical protein